MWLKEIRQHQKFQLTLFSYNNILFRVTSILSSPFHKGVATVFLSHGLCVPVVLVSTINVESKLNSVINMLRSYRFLSVGLIRLIYLLI